MFKMNAPKQKDSEAFVLEKQRESTKLLPSGLNFVKKSNIYSLFIYIFIRLFIHYLSVATGIETNYTCYECGDVQ